MAAGDVEINVTNNNSFAGAMFDGVDDSISIRCTTNYNSTFINYTTGFNPKANC